MIITLENARTVYDTMSLQYIYGSAKFWRVEEPLDVQLSWCEQITIPDGFETDLSSVPRELWSVAPPFGDFVFAAIVHDWLYVNNRNRPTTKAQADREMLIWSQVLNPRHPLDNWTRYYVVRWHPKALRWWNHNQQWT